MQRGGQRERCRERRGGTADDAAQTELCQLWQLAQGARERFHAAAGTCDGGNAYEPEVQRLKVGEGLERRRKSGVEVAPRHAELLQRSEAAQGAREC